MGEDNLEQQEIKLDQERTQYLLEDINVYCELKGIPRKIEKDKGEEEKHRECELIAHQAQRDEIDDYLNKLKLIDIVQMDEKEMRNLVITPHLCIKTKTKENRYKYIRQDKIVFEQKKDNATLLRLNNWETREGANVENDNPEAQ